MEGRAEGVGVRGRTWLLGPGEDSTSLSLEELFKWRSPDVSPDVMHTPSGPVDMVTVRRAGLFMETLLYDTAVERDRESWKHVTAILSEKQPQLVGNLVGCGASPLSLTFWGHVSVVRHAKALEIGRVCGLTFYMSESCAGIGSECFCPAWSVVHDETAANMHHVTTAVKCNYNPETGLFQRVPISLVGSTPTDFVVTVHSLQGKVEVGAVPQTGSKAVPLRRSFVSPAEREKAEREAARAAAKGKAKSKAKGKAAAAAAPAAPEKRKAGKDPTKDDASLLSGLGPAGAQLAQRAKGSEPVRKLKKDKDKAKAAEDASHLLR